MFEEEMKDEKWGNSGATLAIVAVVLLLAAAGGWYFYRTHNHPSIEIKISQTLTVPQHMQYEHEAGFGEDRSEDATYVVAQVQVQNLSAVPFFVKDITAQLTPHGGGDILEFSAIQNKDISRLTAGLPSVQAAVTQIGGKPLEREIKIDPHASASGFVILQYAGKEDIWKSRDAATLKIDFYHNAYFTAPFPK